MAKPSSPTQLSKFPLLPLTISILLPFSSLLLRPVDGQNYLCYDQDGNFTLDETFGKTLDSLFGSINKTSSDNLTYGLFNVSASRPQYPDDIQVVGVCSGDITGEACRDCLSAAAGQVRQLCSTKKQATRFEDKCWIRYSNVQLYGVLKMYPSIKMWNIMNASELFKVAVPVLFDRLQSKAASGGLIRKYAADSMTKGNLTLFGMVQCSPDLSEQDCSECLLEATLRTGLDKVGGRLLMPSCVSRFETYRFFDAEAVPLPSPSAQPPQTVPPPPVAQSGNSSSKTWIAVGASSGSAVVIITVLLFIAKRKIRPKNQQKQVINVNAVIRESPQFDLDTIRAATENFSEANKLGQGGFGSVFRGELPSGQEIAVKRLSQNSGQGESEFENEARLLLQLQHRNLVRLLGYCLEGVERLLVYEFVPNASLDKIIFDPLKRKGLDWDTRYKVIIGITRGLLYLHEDSRLRIIHRDLKAGNILLDMDMNPKISDFGMARLFEFDQTQADTNRIMGTFGYIAPEYAARGNISVKSDVFSFGVLVLEIISGCRNLVRISGQDSEMLIGHAWTNWREGNISLIVDPKVSSGYSADILRCIHIGLLCVQENADSRPDMTSVVRWLDNHSVDLPEPTQPAFFTSRTSEGNGARDNSGTSSIDGTSFTNPYPR